MGNSWAQSPRGMTTPKLASARRRGTSTDVEARSCSETDSRRICLKMFVNEKSTCMPGPLCAFNGACEVLLWTETSMLGDQQSQHARRCSVKCASPGMKLHAFLTMKSLYNPRAADESADQGAHCPRFRAGTGILISDLNICELEQGRCCCGSNVQ